MKRILNCLIFLLIAFSVISGQAAKISKGEVSGTITDTFGALVPEVELILVHLSKGKEASSHKTRSDYDGSYSFSNLPFGVYELRVQWEGFPKKFRKQIDLTSSLPIRRNIEVSFKPCSEEKETGKNLTPITDWDRAEIVNELLKLSFPDRMPTRKVIFVPRNIDLSWLRADHKAKLNIVARSDVQALAEKNDSQSYYWISPTKQAGSCVEISMYEGVALKGEFEDANMAGGGMIYEFKKIGGRWIGQAIGGWIS